MPLSRLNKLIFSIGVLAPILSIASTDVGYSLTQSQKDSLWVNGIFGHVEISNKVDFSGSGNVVKASDFKAFDYKLGIDWETSEVVALNLSLIGSRVDSEQASKGIAVDAIWDVTPMAHINLYINIQRGLNLYDDTIFRRSTSRLNFNYDFTDQFNGGIFAMTTKVSDRIVSRYNLFKKENDSLILSSEKSWGLSLSYKWDDVHETGFVFETIESDDGLVKLFQPVLTYTVTPQIPWVFELSFGDIWDRNQNSPKHSLITTIAVTYIF